MIRAFIYWVLLLSCIQSCFAISLDEQQAYSRLSSNVQYLIDPHGQYSIDELLEVPSAEWSDYKKENSDLNFGFSRKIHWVKYRVQNNTQQQQWLVQLDYSLIDNVVMYVVRKNGQQERYQSGDGKVFPSRVISHRDLLYPLFIEQAETVDIYMRASTTGAVQFPIRIWPKALFEKSDHRLTLAEGFYFGSMLIMAAFVFMTFIMLRIWAYFHYAMFVVLMALFQFQVQGYAFQYLWPNNLWLQHNATLFLINTCSSFIMLFWIDFLRLKEIWPMANKLLLSLAAILITLMFISLYQPIYAECFQLSIIVDTMAVLSSIAIAVKLTLSKNRSAILFLVAWSFAIFGGIIYSMNKMGVLPYSPFSEHALQIGSIIAVVLLSVAITDKINVERRMRLKAQAKSLSLQRDYSATLEANVKDRTKQLEEANRKLQKISATDPLTGLQNRRHFNEKYDSEFSDCLNNNFPFSVIIADVDHFKKINDQYGHSAGDECLKLVADVFKNLVKRSTDSVTRFGGEEFAITLPGTNLEKASLLAEEIRKQVLAINFEYKNKKIELSLSLGVACNFDELITEPIGLLNLADEAMYVAKKEGRDQVVYAPSVGEFQMYNPA